MRHAAPPVAAVAGALLIAAALAVSGADLERWMMGEASGRLSWGPLLFRWLLALHGLLLLAFAGHRARRGGAGRGPASTTGGAASREPWTGGWLAGLVALLAVGLALRLWRLDTGLWLDEVYTLVDYVRLPLREIVAIFPTQNQHMLFSVLARLSVSALGESAVALRLPAVVFGVAGIWAVCQLGRELGGRTEALLAGALMTFSYHHVWFSQNARGYTGLLFFSMLATWLWLRARSTGSGRVWAGYAAAVALGMWVHITMIFVVGAHMLVFLAEAAASPTARRRAARPLVAWLLAGSTSLQLYALSLPEFLRSALGEESLPSEWTSLGWVLRESLARFREAGLGALLLVGGLVALAVGWLDIRRRDPGVAWLLVLPAALGGATMVATGHNLWPRFFFFAMGFTLVIAVRGAMAVPRLVLSRLAPAAAPALSRRIGIALAAAVAAVSLATVPRCYAYPKQDFVGARELVESRREQGEAAVAVGLAGRVFRRYFAPDWPTPTSPEELEALLASHRRVWLVYTLPIQMRAWHPGVWEIVQEEFDVVQVLPGTLGDGAVYVCRSRLRG